MNINEEGKYYASMVRKFRTVYKSKNLQGFCRDQKVGYNKMLHYCYRIMFIFVYRLVVDAISGRVMVRQSENI